jgi:hypothetical protein
VTLDRRFALLAADGDVLFPVMKSQKVTQRFGFALSTADNPDRSGGGVYTEDLNEVIRRVVIDRWLVRVRTAPESGKLRQGSMGLGKVAISAYWVAPELRHIVKDAQWAPEEHLPASGTSTAEVPKPDDKISSVLLWAAEAEIDADPLSEGISVTERQTLIKARVGQGIYRTNLLALWERKCALTNCNVPCTLIASHAKSWADSSNVERLDPYNGLLLAATVDKLFDNGMISFSDDGGLLFKYLSLPELASVGLEAEARLRFVDARHIPYLSAHRRAHGFEV